MVESVAKSKKPPSLASAVSGALSGSLISACVQPLDVLRTKMQGDAAKGLTRGAVGTLTSVLKSDGLARLWQGTQPSVVRVGLGAGLHFVLLEQLKGHLTQQLEDGRTHLSALNAALAGGLSRAVAATLLCPVTVVKTRMEYVSADSTVPRYRNTWHALSSIARTEGARGLFQGLVPTVLTNAPFSALYYMFYSQLRAHLSAADRPQALVNFSSGTVAAVAATLLTQPADVIRTRMQLGLSQRNAWGTLSQVMQQGMGAMLTGTLPRVLKRTTQTALVWTLYEELIPCMTSLQALATTALHSRAETAQQPREAADASGSSAQGNLMLDHSTSLTMHSGAHGTATASKSTSHTDQGDELRMPLARHDGKRGSG